MLKNKQKNRLVVDANIWIRALLKPKFRIRVEVVFGSEYRLFVCEWLFRELDKAIRKPYLEKRIGLANYESLVEQLRTDAELVDVKSIIDVCRDPKDNFLLALVKDGNADYLITGDGDLLVLEKFGNTKIMTLREFKLNHIS